MSASATLAERPAEEYRVRDFYEAFTQTKPGTLGGRYLRQFWHPIARSVDLAPGQTRPIRLLSENFTLYRGETGTPHLTVERCPHRRTQLSVGMVEGDAIRCIYHGWKFGADGKCMERPAEPGPTHDRIRVATYPVGEFLGLVYAFIGEGEAPAFPPYAGFGAEGVIETDEELFEYNYFQGWENDWDLYHAAYTHAMGELHGPISPDARSAFYQSMTDTSVYTETEYGIVRRLRVPNGMENASVLFMPATVRLLIPTFNEASRRGLGPQFRETYIIHTPVDDETQMAYLSQLVPVTGEAAEEYAKGAAEVARVRRENISVAAAGREILAGRATLKQFRDHPVLVAIEDTIAQGGQGRIVDRSRELLGKSDAGVVYLRQLMARELGRLADGKPTKQWSVMTEPPAGMTMMKF
jgi:5,5'-dehydrodivanillate O-demethylase